jgi:NAD(P)-dependent dehydrogenase (short-subunit alcohol dehydrogenase family)
MDANNFYQGKVCVITGAGSGMGKAAATLLVAEGAEVYALDIQPVAIEGIAKYIQVDLSEKNSIDHAFAELPAHIDCFFGVAGILGAALPFMKVACIDLISNKYMLEELLLERMGEGGAIALVSSDAGIGWEKDGNKMFFASVVDAEGWDGAVEALEATGITGVNMGLAYVYSKLAVNYLVARMQKLYGPKHVRVNVIMPGSTNSAFGLESGIDMAKDDGQGDYSGYSGRVAAPEEMARPLLFLNSDMASYISGAVLPVDSGMAIEVMAGFRANPVGESLAVTFAAGTQQ